MDQLKIRTADLKKKNFEFDAICLQECHITDQIDTSQLQLENYHPPIEDISPKGLFWYYGSL